MPQLIHCHDRRVPPLVLPAAHTPVVNSVPWGWASEPYTPAFWRALLQQHASEVAHLRLGRSLAEETSACLLGGYGIPAEVGLAAFEHLRASGLLDGGSSLQSLKAALSMPLMVDGRRTRYRFAASKAESLWRTLQAMNTASAPVEGLALRDWLTQFPGIGLKTASWIVRNHLDCDDVAILDIHILRAGFLMGIFPAQVRLPRQYHELEASFVGLAKAMGVRTSALDACIWAQMKRYGPLALNEFNARAAAAPSSGHRRQEQALTRQGATTLVVL